MDQVSGILNFVLMGVPILVASFLESVVGEMANRSKNLLMIDIKAISHFENFHSPVI